MRRAATAARLALSGLKSAPARCRLPGRCRSRATLARVGAIRQAIADPAALLASAGLDRRHRGALAAAGAAATFAQALSAGAGGREAGRPRHRPAPSVRLTDTGSRGPGPYEAGRAVSPARRSPRAPGSWRSPKARSGQAEQSPGSNESPAIAAYRSATAGSIPGAAVVRLLRLVGRAPGGRADRRRRSGSRLGVGDLVVGAEHRPGGAERPRRRAEAGRPDRLRRRARGYRARNVLPNGQIQTIEGNYENKVAANVRSAGEATGYVSMS